MKNTNYEALYFVYPYVAFSSYIQFVCFIQLFVLKTLIVSFSNNRNV
jgi:hypothetical protein